jgi:hypothetical protein
MSEFEIMTASLDPKMKTCFGEDISYTNYYNMLEQASVVNFKRNKDLVDITEHVGEMQLQHGRDMYEEIMKLNMIDIITLNRIIQINDFVGNPFFCDVHPNLDRCSPNSIKYVYHGLLIIKKLRDERLNDIQFVEVGGGYGGQCIILQELCKLFRIRITKYKLIDLDNVVAFQEKYIQAYDMHHICEFIPYEQFKDHHYNHGSFLFSSYCLSELSDTIRQEYYEHLLPFADYGLIIWNNPFTEDLPKKYTEINHSCHNITGKILSF